MAERITFWYGCNVLRHGDIIHACIEILRLLGFDVQPAGGPDYCCGTAKDANQAAADGMARRTVTRFNDLGRDQVIAWCPSCHSHMSDFMSQAYPADFALGYFVDLLYEHRSALSALLQRPVPMRVLLHRHVGFNDRVQVDAKVTALLKLIPGIEVLEDAYAAPGYMCALLAAVPAAMEDMVRQTLASAKAQRADALVTAFHRCYRELCGLEAEGALAVFNYVQLLARSIGLDFADEYKDWKKSGRNAAAAIGEARLAQVGVQFFERAMLPELAQRPPGIGPKKQRQL